MQTYDSATTGLIITDPYNEFISEGGRVWARCKEVAEAVGMIANTCVESTGRFGMELGYHVTLVRDATAADSTQAMHAAHEVNGPTFAHAITETKSLLDAFGHAG